MKSLTGMSKEVFGRDARLTSDRNVGVVGDKMLHYLFDRDVR